MKEFYISLQDYIEVWTDYHDISYAHYFIHLQRGQSLINLDDNLAQNYFDWKDE
jgi:hypothetical protein